MTTSSQIIVVLVSLLVGGPALGLASEGDSVVRTGLENDAVVNEIVREALAHRPEIAQARAQVVVQRERVPQAGALPDPFLSLGIQNDGFRSIEVGKMETSYYSISVTQGLPFPGKRGLRQDVAAFDAKAAESNVARSELATVAEVGTAYVELLRVRDDLTLFAKFESLWTLAEAVARGRYGVGQGSQADLLRAQLERMRLQQQRWSLEATERTTVQALNRLRGHPLDESIPTTSHLEEIPAPEVPSLDLALRDAQDRSPELRAAGVGAERGVAAIELAHREAYPDLSVTAGVMPRGGLTPMWQFSIGMSLPIFAGSKQSRSIDESAARADGDHAGVESVQQLLALRTRERLELLAVALKTSHLYRSGLLVQSEATVNSTVAQYQVGKVPFASVLEALRGYFSDRSGYLASLAQALRLAIEQQALDLDSPGAASAGVSTPSMSSGSGATATTPASGGGASGGSPGGM